LYSVNCIVIAVFCEEKMRPVALFLTGLVLLNVSARADNWAVVAGLPEPKWEPAAATGGDGLVYVIGGMDDSGPPSNNHVFSYDPASNTWSLAPPLPAGPRRNLAAATDYQGRIYAIAGYTPEFPLSTVERYDPALGYWTQMVAVPVARQELAAATGGDGRIYAIGGVPFTFNPTDRVDAYDPNAGAWFQVASLGTPRAGLGAATGPDGRIYVMGGFGNDAYLNTAEVYDPSTDTWQPISPMQSVRFAVAAAAGPDGRIYAIGGYDGNGAVNTVEAYDPNTDTWTFVASMNYPHSAHAATTGVDGTIYAIGGDSPSGAIVEAYTADYGMSVIRLEDRSSRLGRTETREKKREPRRTR
jgi:kelch-like protein 18